MKSQWEKPAFREVSVNGECTAYSGTNGEGARVNQDASLVERDLAVLAPAGRLPVSNAVVPGGAPND